MVGEKNESAIYILEILLEYNGMQNGTIWNRVLEVKLARAAEAGYSGPLC